MSLICQATWDTTENATRASQIKITLKWHVGGKKKQPMTMKVCIKCSVPHYHSSYIKHYKCHAYNFIINEIMKAVHLPGSKSIDFNSYF